MPSSESSDRGNAAERSAATKYGLDAVDEETGYYDLRASNGVKYQVKSCVHARASGNPGKFRFWREHFERLREERSGIILALTAQDDPEYLLMVEKVDVEAVADEIDGRWFASGHADEGEQYRVPWPDLLSYG